MSIYYINLMKRIKEFTDLMGIKSICGKKFHYIITSDEEEPEEINNSLLYKKLKPKSRKATIIETPPLNKSQSIEFKTSGYSLEYDMQNHIAIIDFNPDFGEGYRYLSYHKIKGTKTTEYLQFVSEERDFKEILDVILESKIIVFPVRK